MKFDSSTRYETRGINESMPLEYRILMWEMIKELGKTQKLDYLQVFEFRKQKGEGNDYKQIIIHKQEAPEYRFEQEIAVLDDSSLIEGKVYVIDDETHSTMLWADEY